MARKTRKRKPNIRLLVILGLPIVIIYVWFYASQHSQWMELMKENQAIESEKVNLERQLSKKQRDQNIILSDEAIFGKATKELRMHRAKMNERNYLPDPRDWKSPE